MYELVSTRCTGGKLILTDTMISVELGQLRSQTMSREAFSSLDYKLAAPSVFGLGGGINLTFHGKGGEKLHANMVKPVIADKIRTLLTGRSMT
jgi:hypothetical protein